MVDKQSSKVPVRETRSSYTPVKRYTAAEKLEDETPEVDETSAVNEGTPDEDLGLLKNMNPKEEPVKNEFVPLWMPVAAFVMIVAAYLYCYTAGIEVNGYKEVGTLAVSGAAAVVCAYLRYK